VLSALAHPNIVSLLSAPESDDARLLVKEWIEGASFDRWADGVWASRVGDEAGRVVTKALVDTARAVAVAHAIGIVHRDIKPTNVLVGAGDTPKVLDFGLAKEIGTVDATRTQGFAGTPSWCAPEQLDGRPEGVDARTDVHALGLLAFRALTGRAAFNPELPIGTLFEAIRFAVPAFSAHDRRRVPNELALVVLRALEKDPARRYANASALADDLERFLAGEPVEAHPPGAVYVARTLVRRHPTAAISLLVATLAVLIGAAAAVIFAIDATHARDEEKNRADEAVAARVSAERMNNYFRDLLANLRERDAAGTPTTAAEIVKLAASSLESRPTPPEVERDLRETLAQVLFEIGDYEGALPQYERLLELIAPSNSPLEEARILLQMATADQYMHRRDDGQARAMAALAALDRLPPEAFTVARGATDPSEPNALVLRTRAHGAIAMMAIARGRGPESVKAADEALRLAEASGSAREIAQVLSTRALALEASGDLQAAAASAKKAVDTARGLGFAAREWSRLLHNAGYLVTSAGRPSEGLTFLDEAYETRMQEFGERHPRTLHTAIQRAYALRRLHRIGEEIAVLERVIELTAAPATGAVDTLAQQRQNALRQIGGAYIERGGEGDRERALMAAEQAIDAWFSNPKNPINRLQTAVGTLTDLVFESAEQDSAAARLRANANRATEISGRPELASLFRAIATQRLMGDRYGRDAWKVFTDIATCRGDSALLIERFGATSSEAFEGEITLLLALERTDDSALRAEAAALRSDLEARIAASFGASSPKSQSLERTRPAAR